MSGSIDAVEAVVDAVESAGSLAQAVDIVHPATDDHAIGLSSARRRIERRLRPIRAVLRAAVTLVDDLVGCTPSLAEVRRRLGIDRVLVTLRRRLAHHLGAWLAPFGFRPRATA